MKNVRPATVAGYFYPADPVKLSKDISLMLDRNKPKHHFKKIFGIVSPHAGYVYSGRTAAHAYNLLKGLNYNQVVVISPSHSEYFPGACVFEGDAYETPLGILEVDKEFSEKLTKNSSIIFSGFEGHRKEHALEVQLPFLQSVLSDFKIVPLVIGMFLITVNAFTQVTASATASATIFEPITISKTVDMNFGNLAVNNTPEASDCTMFCTTTHSATSTWGILLRARYPIARAVHKDDQQSTTDFCKA